MAIASGLIIAIIIFVLAWQQWKAVDGVNAAPSLPPKIVEAPPTTHETPLSAETENQPNPPSLCPKYTDFVTVHYDSKFGNTQLAVRDDMAKKLGKVCNELTTEECLPILDRIIRFKKRRSYK